MQSYSPQSAPSHIESGERQPTQEEGDCVCGDFSSRRFGRLPSLRAISTILKTSSQRRKRASSCGESAGVATTTPSNDLVEYASATNARTEASSSGSMAMRCKRASTPGGNGSVHEQGSLSLQEGQC